MSSIPVDELDQKLLDNMKGLVVKKDLGRQLKGGANVPSFVVEYLLAKYCSTTDPDKLKEGKENVKNILHQHYIDPDRAQNVQSSIKESGTGKKIIDKIEVRLDSGLDKYWANLQNSNIKYANINDTLVKQHDKLLSGGIWAIINMSYDPEIKIKNKIYPFVIDKIQPIQLSTFDEQSLKNLRPQLNKKEWEKLILRSTGLEPTANDMDDRTRKLLMSRLIPMVEKNFNIIELGPRSTGKSFLFREISPYAQLVSGGSTTVPQLFVNNATGRIGMVGLWDVVAFDEAAGVEFKKKDGIQILKDYMESGSFSRGGSGELTGKASIVYNGNINSSVKSLLKTSHLFEPLSEMMQDTAFLDRIHMYLPGWEIMKLSNEHFTNHFGMSVDFFSEFLKERRSSTYFDVIEDYFAFGSHIQQRDSKAIRKTVSGLLKLYHPFGNFDKTDLREYIELAMEMRQRVKTQLKRMGGMEFWKTNFSYIDKESGEEKFSVIPEEQGDSIIEQTPLKSGLSYTVSDDDGGSTLTQVEVVIAEGNRKLDISGTNRSTIKQNIKNVYKYIRANQDKLLPSNRNMSNYDISVQLKPKIGGELGSNLGSAVFVSIMTALFKKQSRTALGILGDISIGGGIQKVNKFSDKVAMLSENGARSILAPIANSQEMADIPQSLLSQTDILFYSDSQQLLQKAVTEG